MLSDGATSARAAASRANGAKSKGPRTAEGKARSSQNALRHGLCGKKHLLLPDDSRAQFVALETALLDDLAPEGALQTLLAHRLIAAAWRLQRADRLEFDLFCTSNALDDGRRLLRDHGAVRAFPTLVRYRSAAQTEFFRTLRALEAVQTKAARNEVEVEVKKNAVVPPTGAKTRHPDRECGQFRPKRRTKRTRAPAEWTGCRPQGDTKRTRAVRPCSPCAASEWARRRCAPDARGRYGSARPGGGEAWQGRR
jgi:hypothetical protein